MTLTGGPGGISLSGTSDVNGEVLFSDVPAGSGYTMTADEERPDGSASPTVVGGTTTTVPIAMPTVSLVATVTWVGANVTGATVTLSGGPMSLSPIVCRRPRAAARSRSAMSRPASGYTLSATKNGADDDADEPDLHHLADDERRHRPPTGTIAVNAATWAGQPAGSATVTISGGPNSPTTYTGTTNARGVVEHRRSRDDARRTRTP